MNTKPNHETCYNPTCEVEFPRGNAYLRSIALVQRAFCSPGCVDMFDRLDKATRQPVPEQRRPVSGRVR